MPHAQANPAIVVDERFGGGSSLGEGRTAESMLDRNEHGVALSDAMPWTYIGGNGDAISPPNLTCT